VEVVYADLDGTLLSFTREYDDLVADAFRHVEGECHSEWVTTYADRFFELFETQEPEPFKRAFAAVSDRPKALADALLEAEIDASEPPPNLRRDLSLLGTDRRLGVLTNGVPEWQRRKLAAHGLIEEFDAIVTSYEAGAHKPDPEPFELAEERLPADAYAMIGDGDADVEGARRAGWSAYRYRPADHGGIAAAVIGREDGANSE